jgi:hypothetical protein
VNAPPPNGDIYSYVPVSASNREAVGCTTAWGWFAQFGATVSRQFAYELQDLATVPV